MQTDTTTNVQARRMHSVCQPECRVLRQRPCGAPRSREATAASVRSPHGHRRSAAPTRARHARGASHRPAVPAARRAGALSLYHGWPCAVRVRERAWARRMWLRGGGAGASFAVRGGLMGYAPATRDFCGLQPERARPARGRSVDVGFVCSGGDDAVSRVRAAGSAVARCLADNWRVPAARQGHCLRPGGVRAHARDRDARPPSARGRGARRPDGDSRPAFQR